MSEERECCQQYEDLRNSLTRISISVMILSPSLRKVHEKDFKEIEEFIDEKDADHMVIND